MCFRSEIWAQRAAAQETDVGCASKTPKHHTTEEPPSEITCKVSASGAVCSSRATSKNSLLMICLLLT